MTNDLLGLIPSRSAGPTPGRTSRGRGEQRAERRTVLVRDCPSGFVLGHREYHALLKDVTIHGGGFLLPPVAELPDLRTGALLELSIHSDLEPLPRKGRVRWVLAEDGGLRFGVGYEGLPADAECIGVLNMDRVKIDPGWALRIPANLALRRQVLPLGCADGQVYVACANALDGPALQAVEKLVGLRVRPEPAEPASLQRALDRVYGDAQGTAANTPQIRTRSIDLRSLAELLPDEVVPLCDEMLHAAILRQASDIHIDPDREGVQVRLRVDGGLEHYRRLPSSVHSGVISRFKVLCGMDIAEKRAPQDGAFKHHFGRAAAGQNLDVRVATLPTKFGERMTLRLLALQTESLTLERLGMCARDLTCFADAIARPHGMILLTGPTGSGKSTTLYAAIRRLAAQEGLNILTVEDPIEYEIRGVAQIEVDAADKVTFVKALRSVLRHDPDVVMIGEIRDAETADVAIKAALTGHLAFSTLHTNSAVSVITRLADMGVDRYLIAATLRLVVAQRLVRQLCPRCRKPRDLTPAEATALGRPELVGRTVYDPAGCIYCGGKGYLGRIGLFELLPLDEGWAREITRGAEETELLARMRERQVATLLDDGLTKLFDGRTAVREVLGAVSAW